MTNNQSNPTDIDRCDAAEGPTRLSAEVRLQAEDRNAERKYSVPQMSMEALHDSLNVVIHPRMLSQLEECFNPHHCYEALTQLHLELPKVHRRHRFWQRCNPVRLRDVYVGRFAQFELTFTYVQSGNVLHVLHLGMHDELGDIRRVDSVIGVAREDDDCEVKS